MRLTLLAALLLTSCAAPERDSAGVLTPSGKETVRRRKEARELALSISLMLAKVGAQAFANRLADNGK